MRQIKFQTERLILVEYEPVDSENIIALLNSPGWLENIGDRQIRDELAAIKYLEDVILKMYRESNLGLWKMEIKKGKRAVGMCGLLQRDYLKVPDIGFAILPEFFGKGYAFEAAIATLQYAYNNLKYSTIQATTVPANVRSIHLLKKLGFLEKSSINPDGKTELLLFENNKEFFFDYFN